MSKIVNGKSLKPRSGAAPKQIVVLLHGFGFSGADMIALAPHWQEALPDALFLAPHAPQRCGMMGAGYQWWGLSGFAPAALAAGAASPAPRSTRSLTASSISSGLPSRSWRWRTTAYCAFCAFPYDRFTPNASDKPRRVASEKPSST